jgi:Family of unknown function (DUF6932)
MPIPNFNEHGFLPLGVHDCSWTELSNRFCRFQSTDRRPDLCRRLREFVEGLRRANIARELLIDGSFVTAQSQPNDIDLILILPPDWDLSSDVSPDQYNLLSRKRVRNRWGFDILIARENSPECSEYLNLFQRVRYQEQLKKGILRIVL